MSLGDMSIAFIISGNLPAPLGPIMAVVSLWGTSPQTPLSNLRSGASPLAA